jgi:hypothetical protein
MLYGTSALLGTGTTTLVSGQIYSIAVEIGTGPSASWAIWINGSPELTGTGNLGSANNGSIKLGGDSRYTDIYYYDDVAISTLRLF